ncbi:hypothetical protein OGAPHI_006595 [Ogataea philodendri]|uniref:Abscisic acid G-protein coupled receptor-like domain-containing protein n=1 Tax=Ogataea philodendri TaxID=1378263 RepID=A0A9P8SZZ0_9ASCO|nr:uncharacterized protein OGAPHI_006595 [Ogataea philodendri]KAH3661188.1 hypothetical protein OGAPHI_006595 [Ogataea philodendri]
MWKETLGVFPLAVAHVVNYQISERLIYRLALPYICATTGLFQSSQSIQDGLSRDLAKILQKPVVLGSHPLDTTLKPLLGDKVETSMDLVLKRTTRVLFNVSVSFSLQIIDLVLFEIVKFGNSVSRSMDWAFTLMVLVFLLTYLIPSLMLFMTTFKLPLLARLTNLISVRNRGIVFVLIFVCWVVIFRAFNVLATSATQAAEYSQFFSSSLMELTLLGVACLATLNGMGSISSLFYLLLKKHRVVKKTGIARSVETLHTTDALLTTRTEQLEQEPSNSDLKNELKALNQIKRELLQDIAGLVSNYKSQQFATTIQGQVSKVGKLGFALYCLYKIINIMFIKLPVIYLEQFELKAAKPDTQTADTLSVTIAKLIARFYNTTYDTDRLATNVSFVFSIFLFFCSFQSVVITFHKFGKLLPFKSQSSSLTRSWFFFDLVVCELTGVYLLSTTFLLHTQLLSTELPDFDHDTSFVDVWFDKCFGLGCVVSGVGLVVSEQIEKFYRDDDYLDASVYDEEALLENRGKLS